MHLLLLKKPSIGVLTGMLTVYGVLLFSVFNHRAFGLISSHTSHTPFTKNTSMGCETFHTEGSGNIGHGWARWE